MYLVSDSVSTLFLRLGRGGCLLFRGVKGLDCNLIGLCSFVEIVPGSGRKLSMNE